MNQIENKQNQILNKAKNFLKRKLLDYFYSCPFRTSKGPKIECYNKKIRKYINTTQISEHLFQYKRIKK